MDVWSWICDLPNSTENNQLNSHLSYDLATSTTSSKSIQLRVEQSIDDSNSENLLTFSIYVDGFDCDESKKTIWVSNVCPLLNDQPFLPLLSQLIQEIISRAPKPYHDRTQYKSSQVKLKPDSINWILQTHSPESVSEFFNIVLLTRLFWLCACDAPSDVGSFYMQSILSPNIEPLSRASHAPIIKALMTSIGMDGEMCIARAIGFMLAKWLIVREMRVGLASLLPLPKTLGLSYANESCGLWMLKGYSPVWGMQRTRSSDLSKGYPFVEAKECALKYALAHQQLEAHIQLEYKVAFCDGYIQVSTRVDNIRVHVAKLGFKNEVESSDEVEFKEELYFPSRIGFWVGPEIGSNYVGGLSLGKSTINVEKEVETQKLVKGSFGKMKTPEVKTLSTTSTKMKLKNWRCDQDVEGNVAVFDAILYENTGGIEVYSTKLNGGGGVSAGSSANNKSDDLGKRYSKVNRPFMKSGGLIFTGKEYGDEVRWRLSKEMEGSVLKWRIGGKFWLTYWPSDIESSYYETRCIEWNDEVDLPLILCNGESA